MNDRLNILATNIPDNIKRELRYRHGYDIDGFLCGYTISNTIETAYILMDDHKVKGLVIVDNDNKPIVRFTKKNVKYRLEKKSRIKTEYVVSFRTRTIRDGDIILSEQGVTLNGTNISKNFTHTFQTIGMIVDDLRYVSEEVIRIMSVISFREIKRYLKHKKTGICMFRVFYSSLDILRSTRGIHDLILYGNEVQLIDQLKKKIDDEHIKQALSDPK